MNTSSKKILKAILISFFVLGYFLAYLLTPHASFQGSRTIEIEKGDGSRAIAEKLKENGFIQSKLFFIFYSTLTGKADNLKPGNFVFSSKSTTPQIVKELARGGVEEQVITILEGWNIDDITDYFSAEGGSPSSVAELLRRTSTSGGEKGAISAASDFYTIAKGKNSKVWQKLVSLFPFLTDVPKSSGLAPLEARANGATAPTPYQSLPLTGLEGYLFPDTYRIYKNASAEEIIIKILENFQKKVTPELQLEIARQKKSLFEVITMASMIEKEVISDEDRALVSGILWKRLEHGIGLNIDATINYIRQTTRNLPPTTGITIDDTKIDSPYNTYKYRGLPPGPISNPGLSAIKSAIYPKKSEYLYYLSKPDGQTVFSQTLEDHNIAKAKYLR